MNDESLFLDYVGDNPRMRILQHFIEGRDFDYTLTDLLQAGVSWGTINSTIPKLLELEMIQKTRKIGRATLYKINKNNVISTQLIELYDKLLSKKIKTLKQEKHILAKH
jgi:hypothetical protein